MHALRDYQLETLKAVFSFFAGRATGRFQVVSPTGTGKSLMQLWLIKLILMQSPDAIIHLITTKLSIVRGYLIELGYDARYVKNLKRGAMKRLAEKHNIYTYVRYRNLLVKGKIPLPTVLIADESHHLKLGHILTDQILYDAELMKIIGFTATDFRSTPAKTKEYREEWPHRHISITIKEAIRRGYWKMMGVETVGTLDDDVLKVSSGGEFKVCSMADINEICGQTYMETIANIINKEKPLTNNGPMIVEVPSVDVAKETCTYLNAVGIPANVITHKTKDDDRITALNQLEAGTHVVVEVSILGEGFDLPNLAVIIDAKPKKSPVEWLQLWGRGTRPYKGRKMYYCLCRNIERHAYLLDGIIPTAAIIQAQEAFQTTSTRAMMRVFGTEKLGRLMPLAFKTKAGTWGSFYLISSFDAAQKRSVKYAVMLFPHKVEPIVATKIDKLVNINPKKPWDWGKWSLTTLPENFTGYKTVAAKKEMSEGQKWAWDNYASKHGLDENRVVDGREFQIMPILRNTNLVMQGV